MMATSSRREAILDAALDVFLEHGVAGAPIEEVCTRAQASVGSVYHHFAGKERLAGAVYLEALASYQEAFLAVLRRHPDEAQRGVRGAVATHLRWCLHDRPREAAFLLFDGDAGRGARTEALSVANREFFAEVLRWWRPHMHYGALRELELDLAYALWLGPAQEYCRLRLAGRTAIAPRRAEPVLADGAWQALRAKGGP